MEAAEVPISQHPSDAEPVVGTGRSAEVSKLTPAPAEPDQEFIRELIRLTGGSFKKCFQCGTCSGTCPLSPEREPFPRKEMAWAVWGLKDRLLTDADIWLCHQCNDCSVNCPRGGRPGDLLAAIRNLCIREFAFPGFMGRSLAEMRFLPLLIFLPVVLLGGSLLLREPIAAALGFQVEAGPEIVFPYSTVFPHWLLNGFFGVFGVMAMLACFIGVIRFWRALRAGQGDLPQKSGGKTLARSIVGTLRKVLFHEDFTTCASEFSRALPHVLVLFGFVALTVVTLRVITGTLNPLAQVEFVYPFGFWSPWKVLANLGGLSLLGGCVLMAWNRYKEHIRFGPATYFDWFLLGVLFLTVITGFASEVLHYLRMVPHRHVVYFIHLVFVFCLLIYLPYSKFAHFLYRLTAMIFVEHSRRGGR